MRNWGVTLEQRRSFGTWHCAEELKRIGGSFVGGKLPTYTEGRIAAFEAGFLYDLEVGSS